MSSSKLKRDIQLLEKQLEEIDIKISDPIERIEQKKQLEKEIKKLERSRSQIEQLEQEQQELESLKSELGTRKQPEIDEKISSIADNSINTKFEPNFNRQVNELDSTKAKSVESKSSIATNIVGIKIKHLLALGVGLILSSVVTAGFVINYNLTKKAEEIRLEDLAKQEIIKAKHEAEQARLEKIQAQEERQEAIQARAEAIQDKEKAEQARRIAIQDKQEVRQQPETFNQIENNVPSWIQPEIVNLDSPKKQIDDLADKTFYSRYPELRGRKIRDNETFFKQKWLQIRDCEATVDYYFYQRYPELGNRKILSGEENLVQEWLQIKRNTSGCN